MGTTDLPQSLLLLCPDPALRIGPLCKGDGQARLALFATINAHALLGTYG